MTRRSHLWLLSILLLVSTASAQTGSLSAGAAKVDITPEPGVSLDGAISKPGPARGVHDRLHARALVLSDGKLPLAIVVCDACMIGQDVLDRAKDIAQETTGIPTNRMLVSATHTHAAVRAIHMGMEPADDRYHEQLSEWIAEAIKDAHARLRPARMGHAAFDRPELIACRRNVCEPGSVAANPFGDTDEQIKSVSSRSTAILRPAGPVDGQFSILSVQHADGSPLVVLGNFSVHYCGGYKGGQVSADYFGYYSRAIEDGAKSNSEFPPVLGIMSNGNSGNTGAFQSGGRKFAPFEGMQHYGRLLAAETLCRIPNVAHNENAELRMIESELTLDVRRPDAARQKWAKQLLSDPKQKGPHRWSRIYAREALELAKYPPTLTIKLQAIRIGDIAIVASPSEVFAETGLAIKAASPIKNTFHIELANGYSGYLPPREQHELGGYETWPARSSLLEINAEQKIREELIRLLHEVVKAQ